LVPSLPVESVNDALNSQVPWYGARIPEHNPSTDGVHAPSREGIQVLGGGFLDHQAGDGDGGGQLVGPEFDGDLPGAGGAEQQLDRLVLEERAHPVGEFLGGAKVAWSNTEERGPRAK
jgi:hypothetical protein